MMFERRFDLFGYRISFRTNVARAAQLLAELYAGKEDLSPDPPAAFYELTHRASPDGGRADSRDWLIATPGPVDGAKGSFGEALCAVEAAITSDLTRHPHGLHVVHGGIVYGPEGDLLLSGNSGVGKTTLSLALGGRGLRVGCDDLAVLDRMGEVLHPHPRCFHLDEHAAGLLAGLGLDLPSDLLRDQFLTPRHLGTAVVPPARLRFVFMMEPERLPRPRIVPETQAEAASSILMQTGRGSFSDLEGVKAIARLVGSARCFRLWSGELGATADAVLRLVWPGHS